MGLYRIIQPDELMHHGILGMKCGVQNGPPYPLGSGDHSASERKAGWRKSLSSSGSSKTKASSDGSGRSGSPSISNSKELQEYLDEKGFLKDQYGNSIKKIKATDALGEKSDINLYFHMSGSNSGPVSKKDLDKTISQINNNFKTIDKNARNEAVRWAFEQGGPWKYMEDGLGDTKANRQDYYNNLGKAYWSNKSVPTKEPIAVMVNVNGMYGEVSYEDGGAYYGHFVSVEYDFKNNKAHYVSING